MHVAEALLEVLLELTLLALEAVTLELTFEVLDVSLDELVTLGVEVLDVILGVLVTLAILEMGLEELDVVFDELVTLEELEMVLEVLLEEDVVVLASDLEVLDFFRGSLGFRKAVDVSTPTRAGPTRAGPTSVLLFVARHKVVLREIITVILRNRR